MGRGAPRLGLDEALGADERDVARAAARPALEHRHHLVDGVDGHAPVGRELAAGHGHDVARRACHLVRRDRSAVRPLAALLTSGRSPAQVPSTSCSVTTVVDGEVQRPQHVGDVVGGALRVVEGAVVVGVGGADVGELAPRHDEQAAPVLGHRDDHGDVGLHLRPRDRDVDPLGRTDAVGVLALVEGAHLVGPHAGGVHDGATAHVDLLAVGLDRCRRSPARCCPWPGRRSVA